jgi:hypothetical protein
MIKAKLFLKDTKVLIAFRVNTNDIVAELVI